jgi:2-aminoadipate transaminase
MAAIIALSDKVLRTTDQPITHYMRLALENPDLISLAPGLVDQESLPVAEVRAAFEELFASPAQARAALQYGTTQGSPRLRELVLALIARLDGVPLSRFGTGVDDVVITTGSQQLLYMLGEVLLNPGDLVITEAPSYFVHHGVLASKGATVRTVPMDENGLDVYALEEMLERMHQAGELSRVKLIYTCDYFQNPSGRTLSLDRRTKLVELAREYSKQHRLLILEDAAYRELGFAPRGMPSIKSFDEANRHVIYAGTFSKPCSPGMKTGYALMPRDLVAPVIRLKGIHDFGSSNLNQCILERVMACGAYDRHVLELKPIYQAKCESMLSALDEHFGDFPGATWTRPDGGMFVWLGLAGLDTGPGGALLPAAQKEGMLYVPGEFCHVPDERGNLARHEMRLSYGVESPQRVREAIRRLRRAAELALAKA